MKQVRQRNLHRPAATPTSTGMRPIATLTTAGATAALLAGCVAPQISDYPVEPPPLTERERDQVRALVSDFTAADVEPAEVPPATELETLDPTQRERLRKAREPFNYGGGGDEDLRPTPREESGRQSEYSRGEINAIERRVNRRYESEHDRRHELKAKYGL